MKLIKMLSVASMLLLLLTTGCKKKKADPIDSPDPVSYDDKITCTQNTHYFPLTKGSYWIYENSFYNRPSDVRSVYNLDSCYILDRDSIVDGKRYTIMATTSFTYQQPAYTQLALYRYSGDYVKTVPNYNVFSYCKTDEILYTDHEENNFWTTEFKVLNKDSVVSVPAGSFEARVAEYKYTVSPVINNQPTPYRYSYFYYVNNIGMIYNSCPYMSSPETFSEKRLVRYHIK